MKGLFLVAKKTPREWLPAQGAYDFEPYYYGPFSSAVYRDLDDLREADLVDCTPVPGRSWCTYSLTKRGSDAADEAAQVLDPRLVDYARRLNSWVGRLSFNDLLTRVYKEFPQYASKSVFRSTC
jgi:predicted ArsR family transcriptional regulator